MSNIAIQIQGMGKQYRIGRQEKNRTLRESLNSSFIAPFQRARGLLRGNASAAANLTDTFWALKDVTFSVNQGEVIGIIGHNGAGKSTLLKILSHITEPTEGRAEIFGRIGALLEVGTGFHPELTGRENIYLNGAILGMGRKEIDQKFDEIVAFSEIENFIDTPVKHYSSGMGLRLGFAVAAHLEPEILIVDEVLAVGDAQFQRKCLGKMSDVASEGRTVLFISHNMVAVQGLCSRAVWLRSGHLIADGPSREIVTAYLSEGVPVSTERVWEDVKTAAGNERVRLRRVAIRRADESTEPIDVSTPLIIDFEYWNLEADSHLNLSIHVYDEQHMMAFNTVSVYDPVWQNRPFPVGLFRSSFCIPADLLNDGSYELEIGIVKDHVNVIYKLSGALKFEVQESPKRYQGYHWHGKWPGALRPQLKWTTEWLDEPVSLEANQATNSKSSLPER